MAEVAAGRPPDRGAIAGYKIIPPDRYEELGIDPGQIMVGTIASENHPGYLLSRFGGNAFGLGLFEQAERLGDDEVRMLTDLDPKDRTAVAAQADRINAIYERLGLFVRYSKRGKPFYLIPLAWLAHSNAEVQDRADILEQEIRNLQQQRFKEQLRLALLCQPGDLLASELTWRFSGHLLTLIDKPADISQAHGRFDAVIVIQDMAQWLNDQPPLDLNGNCPTKKTLFNLSQYMSGKIYDLLTDDGRIIVSAPRQNLASDESRTVTFASSAELKNFLLFSHVFETEKNYLAPAEGLKLKVNLADLYAFLTREVIYRQTLIKLTKGRSPGDLSPAEVDALPHLRTPSDGRPFPDQRLYWNRFLEPFFEARAFDYHRLGRIEKLWRRNLGLSRALPPTELVFVGDRRPPKHTLAELESLASDKGLQSGPLNLVADYKNSFEYLYRVIRVLDRIRNLNFSDLPPLERARLSTPFQFKGPYTGFFKHLVNLTKAGPRLKQLESGLNPEGLEGKRTPVIANLEKMALLGLPFSLLQELFLIVIGHSAIGRVTLGKVPERSLNRLTGPLSGLDRDEVVNSVRVIRLMTVAETAALRDEAMPVAQAAEVFSLAEKVTRIAADERIDWEQLQEEQLNQAGGTTNWAVRRLLKMFGLFEHIEDWPELLTLGHYQKQVRAEFDPERLARMETVISIARNVRRFKERYAAQPSFKQPYFFRRLLDFEFHGTARLLTGLGPEAGFKLIWMAVNLSPVTRINFNPLLTGPPDQRLEARVEMIKEVLGGLSIDDLDPEYLASVAEEVAPHRPVFVRHTDLGLRLEPDQRVMDVILCQVGAGLWRLDELAAAGEGKPISALPRPALAEMDLIYGRLEDYVQFMRRRPLAEIAANDEQREIIENRLEVFDRVSQWLVQVLSGRLFKPEYLHDHLTRLRDQAPRLFARLVPELAEMDSLPPSHPNYLGPTMLSHFLRSAFKFQALASGAVEGFQDKNVLHLLALQEFGLEAAGGIGLSRSQMALLSDLVGRLSGRRYLLRSVGLTLVFQDIGRLPSLIERFRGQVDPVDHGRAGAQILTRAAILSRYPLTPKAKEITGFLTEKHGLLGRVIRGEEPIISLAAVTDRRDPDLFDAFFAQNVITVATVREWSLTEDMFDVMTWLRNAAREVMAGRTTWAEVAAAWRRGVACLPTALREAQKQSEPMRPEEFNRFKRRLRSKMSPQQLARGERETAALDRLYRLRGLWHLTSEAVALFRLKTPVDYIRRLLGVSSLGPASLERTLYEAVRLEDEGLNQIPDAARSYLIDRLSDLAEPVILFGFPYISEYLSQINRFKLLIVALKAVGNRGRVTVSFQDLEQIIRDRYEAINDQLAAIDLDQVMADDQPPGELLAAEVGLTLNHLPQRGMLTVGFTDPLRPEAFARRVAETDQLADLVPLYRERIDYLEGRPENTAQLAEEAGRLVAERRLVLLGRLTEETIRSLLVQDDFDSLTELHDRVKNDRVGFSDPQLDRIQNAFEVRRDQLRLRLEERIRNRLETVEQTQDLEDLWQSLSAELRERRKLLGRRFAERIGRMFDARKERLEADRLFR